MIVRIYKGHDGQTHFEDLPLPAEGSHNALHFRRVPTSCSAVSLRTVGQMEIGIGDGTENKNVLSPGRGVPVAPIARAVLDRVTWSSPTTLQARATRRARWEFRGSVPLCRWAPSAGIHV